MSIFRKAVAAVLIAVTVSAVSASGRRDVSVTEPVSGDLDSKEDVKEKDFNFEILPPRPVDRPVITGHSFLDEKSIGMEIEITGLISGSAEEGFVLSENPDKRNTVSFIIERNAELESVYEELAGFIGKTVTVSGILTEVPSRWTKKISIVSIKK